VLALARVEVCQLTAVHDMLVLLASSLSAQAKVGLLLAYRLGVTGWGVGWWLHRGRTGVRTEIGRLLLELSHTCIEGGAALVSLLARCIPIAIAARLANTLLMLVKLLTSRRGESLVLRWLGRRGAGCVGERLLEATGWGLALLGLLEHVILEA
jgi:hypothetical protein